MSGFSKLTQAFKDLPGDLSHIKKKVEKLPSAMSKAKEALEYTINPNHRHDEVSEQQVDAARTALAKSHRFESFVSDKEGNEVKWYVGGHDYFWAVSELIDSAKESIFIGGWWISPELSLRRPPTENEEYRLDRLLLKKANEGVQIFIVVYKEVPATMTMDSQHTKHHLEDMHENIRVIRHPDHSGGDITMAWSHHQKVCVVDNVSACVGGLDLCFGRWDTYNHPLADAHPTDFGRTLFGGQDYNNARVADFASVDHWVSNQQSRLDTARMPWHDTHMMLAGPCVLDVSQYFIELWNFVVGLKYRHQSRYPYLAFPHVEGGLQSIVRHPHLAQFTEIGRKFTFHSVEPQFGGSVPYGGLGDKGNMRVQVLRSSADWSLGILKENSIQTAYCQMIAEASHYIYIENQFFVTNTTPGHGPVQNLIGKAIVERILSAARAGKKFKVVVVIPAIPGFAGDLQGNNGTLAIMGMTYNSISRGGHSIMECIQREGFDPNDYISFYNLRSYDRLNADKDRLEGMSKRSGVDFDHAQAAFARVLLGADALEEELKTNQNVVIAAGVEGGEALNAGPRKEKANDERAAHRPKTVTMPLPASYDEAWRIVHQFEHADEIKEQISDSVAHCCLKGTGSLMDEQWSGTEESEREAFVTEELYIHAKLMIVDDRRVLMGSANLNDRSQVGDRDSEIALVVEDNDQIKTMMDGKPYMASRFAATLRRQLYKQHLGLATPQFCPPHEHEAVTTFMGIVGTSNLDETASPEDLLVADPLGTATEALWKGTAAKNTQLFDDVFHCVPSKHVEDWKAYRAFVPAAPMKPGHVWNPTLPVKYIKENLDQVRGHLVEMPLNFLKKEDLIAFDAAVNPITLAIYL